MLLDDGRRPKHVGARQSDFNVNFKILSTLTFWRRNYLFFF